MGFSANTCNSKSCPKLFIVVPFLANRYNPHAFFPVILTMPFLLPLILLAFFLTLGYWRRLWLLQLIVVLVPLYVIRFSLPLPGTTITLPTTLLELMLLGYFGAFLLTFHSTLLLKVKNLEMKQFKSFWQFFPLALLLISVVSVAVSSDKIAATGLWRAYFFYPILLYFCLRLETTSDTGLEQKIHRSLLILVGWIGLLAVVQFLTGWGLRESFEPGSSARALAVYETPNAIGLLIAPLLAYLTVVYQPKSVLFTPARLPLLLVGLLGVILSYSRGAWLGLVGALWAWIVSHQRRWLLPLFLLSIVAGMLVVAMTPRLQTFFTDTGNPSDWVGDNSTNVRIIIWDRTLTMLVDRPLTGAGLAGFQTRYAEYDVPGHEEVPLYPHNIVLNFWSELGLAGLLLWGYALGYLLWRSRPHQAAPPDIRTQGMHFFLIVLLLHGLLDVPYFKNDLALIFWLILGLSAPVFDDPQKEIPYDAQP